MPGASPRGEGVKVAAKDTLLTPEAVAARLNISRAGAYRLLKSGQFVGLKVRGSLRILESSVEEYIERQIALFQLENGNSVSECS
jgi:excisionase family DNA binding protein